MIPAIGIMVGFFIITRALEIRGAMKAAQAMALFTIGVAALMTFFLVMEALFG